MPELNNKCLEKKEKYLFSAEIEVINTVPTSLSQCMCPTKFTTDKF